MFAYLLSLFTPDPLKKLRKAYDLKLEQAMQAQRKGDIKSYALLTAESEAIWLEIENKEKNKSK